MKPPNWKMRESALSCEFRKTLGDRAIYLAAERHHQIGNAVQPLPSPGIEFRRLTVAQR
jgi:hypothetical protein